MSVFVWSFVRDFMYHLMPSFVQQILLNWLSKYNQTSCQACFWFVPVEGCSEEFVSCSPAIMLQGCTVHGSSPREKAAALHQWWYRLYSRGLLVLVHKLRKAARPCKSIWSKHKPYCYSILLLQQMMMKRGELPCLSSSVGDQLQETSLYFTSSFRKLSYSFSLKLLLLLQWHLSNLFYSHLFCAAPVFYF